jgi:hypothetical protein
VGDRPLRPGRLQAHRTPLRDHSRVGRPAWTARRADPADDPLLTDLPSASGVAKHVVDGSCTGSYQGPERHPGVLPRPPRGDRPGTHADTSTTTAVPRTTHGPVDVLTREAKETRTPDPLLAKSTQSVQHRPWSGLSGSAGPLRSAEIRERWCQPWVSRSRGVGSASQPDYGGPPPPLRRSHLSPPNCPTPPVALLA